ncbi:MAG: GlsB/YeaQ/YmgE family stress response membrane protein [Candidatus Omnitrophica bacterium]|nr:GlsB/YeaQ/YmgE family stress response membrane protein [Candidatus Omnitrophota bacterium]
MEHNTVGYWIWFLFIGGVIGWVAGLITRGRGYGIPADIVIGIVGAMLGGWIASALGLSVGSSLGMFLLAILGAVVFVGLTRFVVRHV